MNTQTQAVPSDLADLIRLDAEAVYGPDITEMLMLDMGTNDDELGQEEAM